MARSQYTITCNSTCRCMPAHSYDPNTLHTTSRVSSAARAHMKQATTSTTTTKPHVLVCADGAQYFFLFVAVAVSVSMAITSLFRLLGCAFPSQVVAQGVGGFLMLLLIVNSGFIILRSAIPPWVIAFYWVSPYAYSIRALVVNEFTSPRWDRPLPGGGSTVGKVALESLDFYTERCGLFVEPLPWPVIWYWRCMCAC